MGKHPKGHYSKEARYQRKLRMCDKCYAAAEKMAKEMVEKSKNPRKPREKKTRKSKRKGYDNGSQMGVSLPPIGKVLGT
jgi:ribosome-binding protein aMBF1 (putative translation factor)